MAQPWGLVIILLMKKCQRPVRSHCSGSVLQRLSNLMRNNVSGLSLAQFCCISLSQNFEVPIIISQCKILLECILTKTSSRSILPSLTV